MQDDELEHVLGYVLKQAQAALHSAMDAVLRTQELTVAQYACLELLGRTPGLSNADLARGAFVSRQSMNTVLRGLHARGLLTRPEQAPHGRARPTELTAAGRRKLRTARSAVRKVEERMFGALSTVVRRRLRDDLAACTAALAD